jgi:hypothetical protein
MTHPLKGFVEMLMQEQEPETKLIRIGKVNPEIAERLGKLITEHEAQHDDMNAKIEAYVEELAAKAERYVNYLRAEHEPLCKEFQREQGQAWEEIYEELDLLKEERVPKYGIDDLGIVTLEVEVFQENEQKYQKDNNVH